MLKDITFDGDNPPEIDASAFALQEGSTVHVPNSWTDEVIDKLRTDMGLIVGVEIQRQRDLTVTGGAKGTDYTYEGGVLTILTRKPMTISGTTTTDRVVVKKSIVANITLDGVDIDVSGTDNASAFEILPDEADANFNDVYPTIVNLTLANENKLKSGKNSAGLQAQSGSILTIDGDSSGKLTAAAGSGAAGVGGSAGKPDGLISIIGGTVVATGGGGTEVTGGGAGIGSGGGVSSNSGHSPGSVRVVISGAADVTATGGAGADSSAVKSHGGAGIGSGGAWGTGLAGKTSADIADTAEVNATGGAGGSNGAIPGEDIGAGGSEAFRIDWRFDYTDIQDYTVVVEGVSVTCKRLIIPDGKGISAEDIKGFKVPVKEMLSSDLNAYKPGSTEIHCVEDTGELIFGSEAYAEFASRHPGKVTQIIEDGIDVTSAIENYGLTINAIGDSPYPVTAVHALPGFGASRFSKVIDDTAVLVYLDSKAVIPPDTVGAMGRPLNGAYALAKLNDAVKASADEYTALKAEAASKAADALAAREVYEETPSDANENAYLAAEAAAEAAQKAEEAELKAFNCLYAGVKSSYEVLAESWSYSYETFTSVSFSQIGMRTGRAAPEGLSATDETTPGANDGTITGVTAAMEYRLSTATEYTAVTGTVIENLAPGTYDVRYAETVSRYASPAVTLTVNAAPKIYTITFNANGGEVSIASAKTGEDGKLASLPTPTRSGYRFTGWYSEASGGTIVNEHTVFNGDTTIYTRWNRRSDNNNNSGGGSGRDGSSSSNSALSPSKATYDKAVGGDLEITLSRNGNTLQSLLNGKIVLKKDTDYTVNGNKYTLKESYLNALEPGEHSILFDMSAGTDQKFALTITDSTTPETPPEQPLEQSYVNPFTDIEAAKWYAEAVAYVHQNGLMSGTTPTTFSPNMPITRGMIVTILWNLAGNPSAKTARFADVSTDTYYYQAANWAAENGIVSGYNGLYNPGAMLTRQDLAVILANYADLAGMTLPETRDYPGFADDADIANYAKEAIERFFKAQIINGKLGNTFDPKGEATRAEVAAMIMMFLENAE
jgi:uncharacterized repeat protein (TIGR02543 family)